MADDGLGVAKGTAGRTDHSARPSPRVREVARAREDPSHAAPALHGHGARDVTDLYEAHEVTQFLLEDAKTLRAHIGATSTKPSTIAIAQ